MAKLLIALIALVLIAVWNQPLRERLTHQLGLPEHTVSGYVANYNDALLRVNGKKGGGSGFICQVNGRPVAITNAHVLCSNPGFNLTSLNNVPLPVTAGAVAVGRDIVKMEVGGNANEGKRFDMMENVDAQVKCGDAVAVLGYDEGGKTVKPVDGTVVGIETNLVEVDAPFESCDSGSPVIHKATGKVLGVATYLLERNGNKSAKNGVPEEVHRFASRLESVKKWEPINWPLFYAQAVQVEKMELLTKDFIALSRNSGKGGNFSGSYQSMAVQRAVQFFLTESARSMGPGERATVVPRFLSDVRFASRGDIQCFDVPHAYDYFRQRVDEQIRLRDAAQADLTRAMEAEPEAHAGPTARPQR